MSFVITPKIAKKFRKYLKGKKSESWLMEKIRKNQKDQSRYQAIQTIKKKAEASSKRAKKNSKKKEKKRGE